MSDEKIPIERQIWALESECVMSELHAELRAAIESLRELEAARNEIRQLQNEVMDWSAFYPALQAERAAHAALSQLEKYQTAQLVAARARIAELEAKLAEAEVEIENRNFR